MWRDVAVRYKQTSIGVAWAILQPFLTMVVFTFVFGRFANFPSKGVPYPIFTYSALLPWTYFAGAVALASASLVSNRGLVTKVYFPRVLLPLAGVAVPIVDFLLAFVVLVGMMAGSRSGRARRSSSLRCFSRWRSSPRWGSRSSSRH